MNLSKSVSKELIPKQWGYMGVMLALSVLIFLLNYLGGLSPLINLVQTTVGTPRARIYGSIVDTGRVIPLISNIEALIKKNGELESELIAIKSRLSQVETVFSENEQLRRELSVNYSRSYKKIAAEVIGRDISIVGEVILNKGQDDGVKIGDSVVVENILIGKVTTTTSKTAVVGTLWTKQTSIPVSTASKSIGILRSINANQLVIEDILQSIDLVIGENIYTSGLSSDYPPNIHIGQIHSVISEPQSATKSVLVSSPVNYREVSRYIILGSI